MSFAAGRRLGPYEVLAPLGSGGMGEVWRARDPRIGRDVAIKNLLAPFASDSARVARFLLEARAAGRLSHPNILAIYDVGTEEGVPFVVEELVEGETLLERVVRGPLPPRRVAEIGAQIAHGLAAAHAAGIVHRDLKPENVLLTKDGRAKILDFGLAKWTDPGPEAPDGRFRTETGIVLGTPGYMSPEQVRGEEVDHRTDIFCLGTILHEMLTGRRAFGGATAAEAMAGVLTTEPAELDGSVPPALATIVRRCLEKAPEARFQSARDLAFALELVGSSRGTVPGTRARRRPGARTIGLSAAALALLGAAALAGRQTVRPRPPSFQQLTFRRGTVRAARFTPDGGAVVYAAAWDGGPARTYAMRPERPEAREVGDPGQELLSVSARGELLVARGRRTVQLWSAAGTLARLPLEEGAARDLAEDVAEADWGPDGESFCVVRTVAGRCRLEYPAGRVLYETSGYVADARVAPDGERVAFLDHPSPADDAGEAAVVDLSGKKTTLSGGWLSAAGLAWSPDGREVWFTAAASGAKQAVHAVSLSGRRRTILSVPGTLTLRDVSRTGRALLTIDRYRLGVFASGPDGAERDLSWLDWSHARDLSPDGSLLVFDETAEGGGPRGSAYLRRLDGALPVRLGDGTARAIAPDGTWAIASLPEVPKQLLRLPTGAGTPQALTRDGINHLRARVFPDGKSVLFAGSLPPRGARLFVQRVGERTPHPISPEGIGPSEAIAPDGLSVAAVDPAGALVLYPAAGGAPRPVPGSAPGDLPIAFSADGGFLYVRSGHDVPARLARIALADGARAPWRTLAPADRAGVDAITDVLVSADGGTCVYGVSRILSDLFVVDGLR